ncbi:MAG: hypothetical protein DRQ37_04145, partial [Gammaproteobacteria bacterium]
MVTDSHRRNTTLPPDSQVHWYTIRSVLGEGGFGVTYDGEDTNLRQSVALKEYFPSGYAARSADGSVHASSSETEETYQWGLSRFLEEARTVAQFRHPNIVRVLSVFEENGTAYMAMELESGASLTDLIRFRRIADEAQLLEIIHPLLDALETIHASGFIHRDIKPDNILIRHDGSPVLLDFGSARQALGEETQHLTAIVTPGYSPFEQFNPDGEQVQQGPWTDIYAFAATMHSVIVGRRPGDDYSRSTLDKSGPDGSESSQEASVGGRYSEAFLDTIDKALQFHPSKRPQTIAEWREMFPGDTGKPEEIRPATNEEGSGTQLSPAEDTDADGNNAKSTGSDKNADDIEKGEAVMSAPELSHLRVLVVDDEPFILNLTKRVLNNLGIADVETAENGKVALDTLAENAAFDVILCDLNMPEMDGIEFLRHLGERNTHASLVLVSGEDQRVLSTAEALARSHGLDVLGTIQKPIKPDPLVELLGGYEGHQTRGSFRPFEPLTEEELLEGLEGDAVVPVFQPKVSTTTRRVVGVETLARWRHPDRGILGPGAFIALAEECGQIDKLTDIIFHQAVTQGGEWRASGLDLKMAVNFSVDSLNRLDLPEYVVAETEGQGMDPSQVIIEVTESRLMKDFKAPMEILARLRLKGIGLSIDDFGTGYSSMEQLKRIPFTEIKVDRAFVFGACEDPAARAILESSISLGKKLDMSIVAEGAETQEEWDLVAELGVDLVQGYFVAKPMPGEEIAPWVEKWE